MFSTFKKCIEYLSRMFQFTPVHNDLPLFVCTIQPPTHSALLPALANL